MQIGSSMNAMMNFHQNNLNSAHDRSKATQISDDAKAQNSSNQQPQNQKTSRETTDEKLDKLREEVKIAEEKIKTAHDPKQKKALDAQLKQLNGQIAAITEQQASLAKYA